MFPKGDKIRARKVVSRSRARSTGKYPSWKMGRMMQWESLNELNAFRLLDANPAARAYHEQPLAVRFALNGETHIHYPDVLVQWIHGAEIWEIKPESEAAHAFIVERTRLLESSLPQWGFKYRLITGEELAKEPRRSNALTMLRHGRRPVSEIEREHIRQVLLRAPAIHWSSTNNGELGPDGRAVVCRLVLEGFLSFDINQALTAMTSFHAGNDQVAI